MRRSSHRWVIKRSGTVEALSLHRLGLLGFFGFLLAADVEAAEVDGVEQEWGEAAFARDVGHQAAQEREQNRWAVDQQERLKSVFWDVLQFEQSAVDALHDVDRAVFVGGVGFEFNRALEQLWLHTLGVDVHFQFEIWVLAWAFQ